MNIVNNSFLFYAFKIKIVTVNLVKKEKVDILVAFFPTINNATVKFLITCVLLLITCAFRSDSLICEVRHFKNYNRLEARCMKFVQE